MPAMSQGLRETAKACPVSRAALMALSGACEHIIAHTFVSLNTISNAVLYDTCMKEHTPQVKLPKNEMWS